MEKLLTCMPIFPQYSSLRGWNVINERSFSLVTLVARLDKTTAVRKPEGRNQCLLVCERAARSLCAKERRKGTLRSLFLPSFSLYQQKKKKMKKKNCWPLLTQLWPSPHSAPPSVKLNACQKEWGRRNRESETERERQSGGNREKECERRIRTKLREKSNITWIKRCRLLPCFSIYGEPSIWRPHQGSFPWCMLTCQENRIELQPWVSVS